MYHNESVTKYAITARRVGSRTRWRLVPVLAAAALAIGCETAPVAQATSGASWQATPAASPARIGVYDSRAVALVHGRSAEFQKQLADLHARHQKAVADGDEAMVKRLTEQGEAKQIRLHLQVFSNAPADDAIERIRDRLPEVAAAAGVCAIVPSAEFHGPSVEVVDVTERIVELFSPTPETMKLARQTRDHKPAPIEQIARVPAANR